jgi:hypothetical protein
MPNVSRFNFSRDEGNDSKFRSSVGLLWPKDSKRSWVKDAEPDVCWDVD